MGMLKDDISLSCSTEAPDFRRAGDKTPGARSEKESGASHTKVACFDACACGKMILNQVNKALWVWRNWWRSGLQNRRMQVRVLSPMQVKFFLQREKDEQSVSS